MSPAELIECLSLIGSQHGVGRTRLSSHASRHTICDAPAATVLRAAASAIERSADGDVRVRIADGHYMVLSPADRDSPLVNYA